MSIEEFHKSSVRELLAVKDRVRNLISHWPEDGRHHEAVLISVIRRFLPEHFKIGTGFVVKQTEDFNIHNSSKQIDLIVYDSTHPVLFKEGDFVILTPDAVNAIVEVKANLAKCNLSEVLKTANENGKFVFKHKVNYPFFNGVFSFEGSEHGLEYRSFELAIQNSGREIEDDPNQKYFRVNHVAFNEHFFYKYWQENPNPHKLYRIENLSFAYFISNLIDSVSVNSVMDNIKLWFPRDKSFHMIHEF